MKSLPALCYQRLDEWWVDRPNRGRYKEIFNPKTWAEFLQKIIDEIHS